MSGVLPHLHLADFGPGKDHVAEAYQHGRIFAILHGTDPARQVLPTLDLNPTDDYTYVFIHGGQETTRFENLKVGTHEIPSSVVAQLLAMYYGSQLNGLQIRLCTCYGNLLRPGDTCTTLGALARVLPQVVWEGYHGLVHVDLTNPPQIRLGDSLAWDSVTGPFVIGPPGSWETVVP